MDTPISCRCRAKLHMQANCTVTNFAIQTNSTIAANLIFFPIHLSFVHNRSYFRLSIVSHFRKENLNRKHLTPGNEPANT